jgi:hypothetical protein
MGTTPGPRELAGGAKPGAPTRRDVNVPASAADSAGPTERAREPWSTPRLSQLDADATAAGLAGGQDASDSAS